jgi:uncharacterized repeat protein (TIGR02543 family)
MNMNNVLYRSVRASLVPAFITLAFFGASVGIVSAGPARVFTASITPTTATASATQSYTLTITDASGAKIKSASVVIPSGYTNVSVTSVGGDATGWSVSTTTSLISLKKGNDISNGKSITIQFSATAPTSPNSYEWTTSAYESDNWGADQFDAPSSQPTVTVSAASGVSSVTVGSQTGTLTEGTAGSATYTVTAQGSGSATVAWSVSGLPSGATGFFAATSTSATSGSWPVSTTLTVFTTSGATAGSSDFTVSAGGKSNTGTLLIDAASFSGGVNIDSINGNSPSSYSCPSNPLTNPVSLTGSGSGSAPPGNIGQYKVQIDWGDGNSDSGLGTFTPNSGQGAFTFTFGGGPHSYATDGTYTITARLYHQSIPGNDGQADTVAKITTCIQVTPLYAVTYDGNGSTGGTAPTDGNSPYASGATVTVLGNTGSLVKTGFSFNNWNTLSNGSGTSYAPAATFIISSNTTLFAQWTALSPYTVTFDANGGSGSMSDETSNVPAALTANSFTNAGYTFIGWNTATDGSGTSYSDGDTYSFSADVTLYAQWTSLPTFIVTFDANGGSGSMTNEANNVPAALTTNTFIRTGYTFSGWNTAADGSGTSYADGATYDFSANVTLYAQWAAVSTPPNSDGGGNKTTGGNGPIVGSFGLGGGQVLGASTSTVGQVLSASTCSTPLLSTYMRTGKANDSAEVKKLQQFLNDTISAGLPLTGVFGPLTEAAVKNFQKKYADQVLTPWGLKQPTGLVYLTTRRWINLLYCQSLDIPIPTLMPWSQNSSL